MFLKYHTFFIQFFVKSFLLVSLYSRGTYSTVNNVSYGPHVGNLESCTIARFSFLGHLTEICPASVCLSSVRMS